MLSHLRRSLLALLCGLSLISASGVSLVAAQSTGEVRLAIVETVNFPRLSTYLEVRDGEGNFLYDLQPADVHVIENEVELPIAELNLIRPGVQMVVAINPGPSFAIRDAHRDGAPQHRFRRRGRTARTGAVGRPAGRGGDRVPPAADALYDLGVPAVRVHARVSSRQGQPCVGPAVAS